MKQSLYVLLYALLISLCLSIFFVSRPYSVIDHSSTKIICQEGKEFKLGENFVFVRSAIELQSKAYKLCQGAPLGVDIHYENLSSYPEALILSGVFFFLAYLLFSQRGKQLIISALIGTLFFLLFLRMPADKLFSDLQKANLRHNFKIAAYGYGWLKFQNENINLE